MICDGLTKESGADTPLTVRDTPFIVVGNGALVAVVVPGDRSVPNRLAIDPGASGGADESAALAAPAMVGAAL